MMGDYYAQNPSPPHFYSQSLQLKLYQAFIFSIPILFSIILFLLFYLFYLKRRANSALSSSQPMPSGTSSQDGPFVPAPHEIGLKGDLRDKLPMILFDEDLKARGSQCCVCLGEFEMEEELQQVPLCKHVFHVDCLHHWLHSNSTCPLCRCLVIPFTEKPPLPPLDLLLQQNHTSYQQRQIVVSSQQQQPQQQQQQTQVDEGTNLSLSTKGCHTLQVDGESSSMSSSEEPCRVNESVVLNIRAYNA